MQSSFIHIVSFFLVLYNHKIYLFLHRFIMSFNELMSFYIAMNRTEHCEQVAVIRHGIMYAIFELLGIIDFIIFGIFNLDADKDTFFNDV